MPDQSHTDPQPNPTAPSSYVVYYMPWAGLDDPISVGGVTFWPFRKLERTRIANADVRCFLGRYFDTYVDWMGDIEKDITIVCHGPDDFREFTEDEMDDVMEAANWLAFSAIAMGLLNQATSYNNSQGSLPQIPKGDHFALKAKKFIPGDTFIAFNEGGMLSGFSLGQIKITRPLHLPAGDYRHSPNSWILDGFRNLRSGSGHGPLRNRFRRSIEWFLLAYSSSVYALNSLTRVTMMATAYEILFDFPSHSGGKKKHFALSITSLLNHPSLPQVSKTLGKPPTSVQLNTAGEWACDFYELRSTITHGDEVTPALAQFRGIPNLGVANWLFCLSVLQNLWKDGFLADQWAQRSISVDIALGGPGCATPRAQLMPQINDAFTGMGWIPTTRARTPALGQVT